MLSADQQSRFARHLLLDDLGGEGQERLVAGAASVELPDDWAVVARWAVRYLAASGVGTLALRGPWAEEAGRECAGLWPEVRVELSGSIPATAVRVVPVEAGVLPAETRQIRVDARGLCGAAAAALGARVALEALKLVAGVGQQREHILRGAVPGELAP